VHKWLPCILEKKLYIGFESFSFSRRGNAACTGGYLHACPHARSIAPRFIVRHNLHPSKVHACGCIRNVENQHADCTCRQCKPSPGEVLLLLSMELQVSYRQRDVGAATPCCLVTSPTPNEVLLNGHVTFEALCDHKGLGVDRTVVDQLIKETESRQ
jgi:hypothetical protein